MPVPPLFITGVPHAGGAIVLQALWMAGVTPSRRSSALCPIGRLADFRDPDVAYFHDQIIGPHNSFGDCSLSPIECEFQALPQAEARLKPWIARQQSGEARWIWCDSRAVACLDVWERLVPDARWIFVLREPGTFVWSVVLRGTERGWRGSPLAHARRALRFWVGQAARILRYRSDYPERTHLIRTPLDYGPAGVAALHQSLETWHLTPGPVHLDDIYNPYRLKKQAPRWISVLTAMDPQARRLWRAATSVASPGNPRSRAGLKSSATNASADGRARICVINNRHHTSSETFVAAHLQRLPAQVLLLHGGERDPLRTDDHLSSLTFVERCGAALRREFGFDLAPVLDRGLARYLERRAVQAVLAEFGWNGVRASAACARAGIPLVVHFHGADAYGQAHLDRYREAYPRLFHSASAIVVVSRDMERQLADLGAPRGKIVYNPCGVDTTLFTGADPRMAPPLFVSVGRFVDKKGPHLTLLAFREVLRQVPSASLVMAGDGPLLEPCRQLAKIHGLDHAVEFAGVIQPIEVSALLRTARAFVQHSLRTASGNCEGTPVAILEAGAAGLPVVASANGGIPDVVVDGETGFLVPEANIEAMAARMAELAVSPGTAGRLGSRAQAYVRANFSMEASLSRLWEVIEHAMADSGHARSSLSAARVERKSMDPIRDALPVMLADEAHVEK